jgi:hypothetical protein
VGPELIAAGIAAVGLSGAGVAALWKIANGLGKFEARTTTILSGIQEMLTDHEQRLRHVERRDPDSDRRW